MSELTLRHEGATLWITLSRHTISTALAVEIGELADELDRRDDVRAVVITGAGPSFSTGIDPDERAGMSPEREMTYMATVSYAIDRVGKLGKPTICGMNGPATDAGLELAMACDFRILVDSADVGLTAVRQGVIPAGSGTQRLPRLIGEARARELILLGRRIPAARALEIGLVHAVAPAAGLAAAVEALVAELAGCAPQALRSAKTAISDGYGKPLDAALELESQCFQAALVAR